MKPHLARISIGLIAAVCISASGLRAQVPEAVHFQGHVTRDGSAFDGAGDFKFAIVDDGTANVENAAAEANVVDGFVTSIAVIEQGAGYAESPAVAIMDETGSGAEATASVEGGRVVEIQVVSAGSGYSDGARVVIAEPPPHYQTLWSHDGTSADGGEPDGVVSVDVREGVFSVMLGDGEMTPLDPEVFKERPTFLRVWFSDGQNGFEQLGPDQKLAASPYALVAATALEAASFGEGDFQVTGDLQIMGTLETQTIATANEPLVIETGGEPAMTLGLPSEWEVQEWDGEEWVDVTKETGANVIFGYHGNSIENEALGAVIGGGGFEDEPNIASGDFSVVSGGYGNEAANESATVGGGSENVASGREATVSGGSENTASGQRSAVGGGGRNTASGQTAMVGGGWANTASGRFAVIPGGNQNRAAGDSSFAVGHRARADHDGAFVWADTSTQNFSSSGEDQFLVQARGGVGINTNEPPAGGLRVAGTAEFEDNVSLSHGSYINLMSLERDGQTPFHFRVSTLAGGTFDLYRGTVRHTRFRGDGDLQVTQGTVIESSDERLKTDMEIIPNAIDKIGNLNGYSFRWKNDDRPAMGLSAQEVKETFPQAVRVSEDGYLSLSYGNMIPVLIEGIKEQQEVISEQEARIAELETALEKQTELKKRLARIEGLLKGEEIASR